MEIQDEHIALLKKIQEEWNQAEQDIKIAEQVVHNIVFPAIKELRYGGRRIIDALVVITSSEADDKDQFRVLLEEARFDCHRARHDAVDAASAKISTDLESMTKHLGHGPILAVYPDFAKLVQRSIGIREKINQSRANREDRHLIYGALESGDFPILVTEFNTMKSAETMMVALAKKDRQNSFYGKWGFWIAVIGVALCIIFEIWHHFS